MSGFTDGPWQSKHDFDRDGQLTIIGAIDGPDGGPNDFYYTTVCIVEEGEQATANARSIAALPDVLDALRLILPLAKGYAAANRVGSNAAYVAAAEAALTKAGAQ